MNEARKKYVHSFIGIALMFIIPLFPAVEPLTHFGMQALGVFVGTVYLWITVEQLWPSIFAIFMYAFIGYTQMSGAIAMALGNDTVWMTILMMALLGLMGQIGLTDHIVALFLARKFLKGHPWLFSFIFLILTAILAAFINAMVAPLLMWQLLSSVRDIAGYKNGDPWLALMTVGVCLSGAIGGCVIPFNGLMLFLNNILRASAGVGADFLKYMCFSIPITFFMIVAFVLMMRFVFRVDVGKITSFDPEVFMKDLGPMTKIQKAMLMVFAGLFLCLCIGPYLPPESYLGGKYAFLGSSGIVVIIFVIASIVKVDGEPICSFQKAVSSIPWSMVFMIAVAMSISTVLLSEEAGLQAFLIGVVTPILNNTSSFVFIVAVLSLAAILTNISNNFVVAFVFTPLLITINAITAIPLVAYTAMLCFAVNFALILPSGSPTAAMLYSSEMMDHRKHFLYTITAVILELLIMIVIGSPLATFFLG